ncbi:MAG: FMN-binding protein [Clostridiales Family XIII bacterium]|jgi:uncharacterized protein with FMN-binding domain|nr:FMN-binding protein [Clostridiales Family XIII bacterium]
MGSFLMKSLSIVVVVVALFFYNQIMALNAELATANATIEELSEGIAQDGGSPSAGGSPGAATPADGEHTEAAHDTAAYESPYADGIYEGTAQGYGGPVTTKVTILQGTIVGLEIVSAEGEDAAYYNLCLGLLDEIAEKQGAEGIDAVSGATYTSDGILGGVRDALAQAEQ